MSYQNSKAVIYSVEGLVLNEAERAFFKEARPLGFILFGRNCSAPTQLSKLCADLRESVGWHCPILIDQEGGRVQRLKPPVWRGYPAMQTFGARASADMEQGLEELRFCILQMAEELKDVGVNVTCAPVLDVLTEATHDVIGDRAFSENAEIVGRLGLSVCRNLLAAGVMPVLKHFPGHGRATCDSHKELPRVGCSYQELSRQDFNPFRFVSESDVGDKVWGMVAHVIYETIDPENPASVSAKVIQDVIRGEIGFNGLLLSDDLDMGALVGYGDVAARTLACLDAGCDVALYCAGDLGVMQSLHKVAPDLSSSAQKRLQNYLQ